EDELRQVSARWSGEGFHIQHHNRVLAECYVGLYRGSGSLVWERLWSLRSTYARSLLPRVQVIRIELRRLRALGALMSAKTSYNPAPLFQRLLQEARRLNRERVPGAAAHASLIRGLAAVATGEDHDARPLIETALQGYVVSEMPIFAAATRRYLGRLLGGDD